MTNIHEIERLLGMARTNAAQDLSISNDILGAVDDMVKASETGQLDQQRVAAISKALVDSALKLTEQSRKMSLAISKAVGAI